jgi:SAM-dependent methyltransferase
MNLWAMGSAAPRYDPRPASRGPIRKLLRAAMKPWRTWRITQSPDRVLLVSEMLPAAAALGGNILWVGVRQYTKAYPACLEQEGGVCWTLDFDPRAARWGQPGRHVVSDLVEIDGHFAPQTFTAVLCNGVFGWGVDGADRQTAALAGMRRALAPGGLLLLGWNTDRMDDPDALAAAAGFEPCGFAGLTHRHDVADTTHVYQFYRRA